EMQHLVDDDDVKGIARHRQVENVALPDAAVLEPGMVEPAAGKGQHVEGKVDAETALDLGAEHFEDAPGAGTEIEQRAERTIGELFADRGLDHLVGRVQAADAIPFGGMAAKIVLRDLDPRGAHPREALAIARND